MRKAPATYMMNNDGLGFRIWAQSVKGLEVSIKGLTPDERAAVIELVGYVNNVPEEESQGTATEYQRGLFSYAVRTLGPLWRELRDGKLNQVRRMLSDYVARSMLGYTHDDEGRAGHAQYLADGTVPLF